MQFPAFGFKNWDFFGVWGVEKRSNQFFSMTEGLENTIFILRLGAQSVTLWNTLRDPTQLTGYSPTSGTWIFPWFFWNQIFYRSFVGVRLWKLINPTGHPCLHPVGIQTNLNVRNFQIWPTLRASIALFQIDNANNNKSIGLVIDSISHVKLKQFLPWSRS